MSHELEGKVALVTGGAGAIGAAVAAALTRAGAIVVSADKARAAVDAVQAGVHAEELDITSRDDVVRLVTHVVARHGALDILVNAAGVVSFGSAGTLAESEWDRVLDINLKGVFLACQAAMAPMKASGFGRIVNIGSVVGKNAGNARPWRDAGEQAKAGNVAYGVSKAGVHMLTLFLAKELAAHGVTVNAVAPGPIETSMTTGFPDALRELIPAGRMGTPEDVARAVLFLCAPENGFVTGEILDINGGMYCD
ncbi:MAG TPA: SDR family NAD(P)-dependent oxidoreductase [Paraburkholderia sp.]|jgi:NAD(P)-dependent dehydrogenase (short-subunit alcohol dehydrogenase family)|uniref:SDR family NAD(P)-dependent oxidoreductase n=1 Tax=Paraburkholderia sp. TaxID=1926495 RepID=UPI002DEE09DC|nr:SDR family NAD(P)-dependent oxidoreductase [Paraburkholderia sp.]